MIICSLAAELFQGAAQWNSESILAHIPQFHRKNLGKAASRTEAALGPSEYNKVEDHDLLCAFLETVDFSTDNTANLKSLP